MFLSIGVYFIGIFFFLDVKNITDKFRKKTKNKDENKNCCILVKHGMINNYCTEEQ